MIKEGLVKGVQAKMKEAGIKLNLEESAIVVDAIVDTIKYGILEDGEVKITGLGTFKATERKATVKKDIKTKEEYTVPAKTVPTIKFSEIFKQEVIEKYN